MNPLKHLARKADCYRQGDVILVPVPSLEKSNLRPHRPVLAEGEVTGHAHRLQNPSEGSVFSEGNRLFLEVTSDTATITHDEHHPVTLPRGNYEIRIQREYHPAEIRRVVD